MHKKAKKQDPQIKRRKTRTYGVESTSRAGGAREAPGVRLRSLALQPTSTQVLQYHAAIKTITLHEPIILKSASTRSGANLETLVSSAGIVSLTAPQGLLQSGCTAGQQLTSLAPQDLKKSQSSAGFVKIVESAAGIVVGNVSSAGF